MGGIDIADQYQSYLSTQLKTWHSWFFFFLADRSINYQCLYSVQDGIQRQQRYHLDKLLSISNLIGLESGNT